MLIVADINSATADTKILCLISAPVLRFNSTVLHTRARATVSPGLLGCQEACPSQGFISCSPPSTSTSVP
jgi:hypothetical protein